MAHTGEVRALWIVALLAGCEGESRQPMLLDAASGPVSYELAAHWTMWGDQPDVQPRPVVYIDGVMAEARTFEYATPADALAAEHVIELRHGDVVVFSAVSTATERTCLDHVANATVASESWCAYPHGELRFDSDKAGVAAGAMCIGDGFCLPRCGYAGGHCASGEKCTSLYASLDPIATHLGCAPIGDKGLDEACTFVTDATGMHDDCDGGLLCVEGTCQRTCVPTLPLPEGCTACSYVYGHAPEIGVCE